MNREETMKRLLVILLILNSPFVYAHLQHNIHLTDEGFVPQEIEVDLGATVVFENNGKEAHWPASNDHPTHQIYSEFDPKKPIKPGETWLFTFDKAGTWKMHDHLSPQFTGSIIARESESTGFFASIKSFFADMLAVFSTKPQSTNENSSQITALVTQPLESYFDDTYNEYNRSCDKYDFNCIKQSLMDITGKYGPGQALAVLGKLEAENSVDPAIDDHELAHVIGRTTAQSFGFSPELFFECETEFDYGCQHGFFEYVLSKTSTGEEAISLICDKINSSYSIHYKHRCYHGAGHGVMMANAYDLNGSLSVCDDLNGSFAQGGCWQGAMMENVNLAMRGEGRNDTMSKTDPLAPCNKLQEKYQNECFYNHAPWLMKSAKYDVKNATQSCLKAPQNSINICLQGLGLTLTSPKWHALIIENWKPENFIENTWDVCKQFPENHTDQCIIGGIDNILNFDQLNISRAEVFCGIVDGKLQETCYHEIGRVINVQATDNATILQICTSLQNFSNACLGGTNLKP